MNDLKNLANRALFPSPYAQDLLHSNIGNRNAWIRISGSVVAVVVQ